MRDVPPPPTPLVAKAGRPPSESRTRAVAIRECRHHGLVEFGCYGTGKGGLRWRCKRCLSEAVTRRHQRLKRLLVEEAGGRCAVCGYDRCIVNLCFHHVDPASKAFPLTVARGKSIAACRAELRKCVLVCANCHGEIESGLVVSPPAGTKFVAQ